MIAKDNTGANNGLNNEINTNQDIVINVIPDNDHSSRKSNDQNNYPVIKPSNRNSINFMGKVNLFLCNDFYSL